MSEEEKTVKGKINKRRLLIVLAVGVIVLFLFLMRGIAVEDILAYMPRRAPFAILVFMMLFALKTITIFFPMNLLYLAVAAMFPPIPAIMISYAGVMVCMSIGYIGGKKLGVDEMENMLKRNPRLGHFVEKRRDNVFSLCFLGRVSPVHFDPFSMLCGAMSLPFIKYMGASLLGVTFKLVPIVLFGFGIISILQSWWAG